MARIEPLPVNKWPPEMQEALAAIKPPVPRYPLTRKGRPTGGNILGTMAHHPALARAYNTLNGHEWAQHVFLARDAGLTDLEIAWIAWGPDAPFWSELESALLRAVDELVGDGAIGDKTWTVLSTHLDPQQLLDVIFTAGSYTILAWMMQSLDITLDDDLRKALGGTP
jgi:hypothetical protein